MTAASMVTGHETFVSSCYSTWLEEHHCAHAAGFCGRFDAVVGQRNTIKYYGDQHCNTKLMAYILSTF